MEVQKILAKVRQPKEEKKEYFFALQIDPGMVRSAIWTVDQGEVRVVSLGSAQEWSGQEELIEATDESLSLAAEKFFPQDETAEPTKIIFGLPLEWVEGEKITAGKIDLLKLLSEKLDLSPVGFVVNNEAVVHHLKNLEGIPPTAILVGLGKTKLEISFVNLGKIMGSEIVKRSENIGDDLLEGLSRFEKKGQFPARILIYKTEVDDQLSLEEVKQELISYPWKEKEIGFLHLPKVEALADDFKIKAIALAGGHEVAKAEGIEVLKPPAKTGSQKEEEEGEEKKEPEKEPEIEPTVKSKAEEEKFGFVSGRDITEGEPLPLAEEPGEEKRKPSLPFRFKLPRIPFPRFSLAKLKFLIPRLHLKGRFPLLILILTGLMAILGGALVAAWWYLPQAKIVLYLSPQRLEKEFELKLISSAASSDTDNLELQAKEVKVSIEGSKTGETIGTKTVGDSAKGEVTIYNRTASSKTFPAGTQIVGPDELTFTLDEEVKVASESAGSDYTRVPGKVTVGTTALEIGTEGNLASETEFAVDNFAKSDFVAKNGDAFSGGSSREIQVVSEKDQENLLAALEQELKAEAGEKLLAEVSSGKKLLEESMTTQVLEKTFDHAVGDETSQLSLELELEAKALSYSESELRDLIENEIKKLIPADFEYRPEESEISFSLKEISEDSGAVFNAYFEADLIPRIEAQKIREDLAGKYPQMGKMYLQNLPNVKAVEIEIRPRLPEKITTLPRVAERIKIESKIEK